MIATKVRLMTILTVKNDFPDWRTYLVFGRKKDELGRLFKRLFSNSRLVISTSSSVLNKVKEIDRKIDELREFLEDVFLTPEEYRLLREVDNIVKERKLSELTPLDEVQGSTSQES